MTKIVQDLHIPPLEFSTIQLLQMCNPFSFVAYLESWQIRKQRKAAIIAMGQSAVKLFNMEWYYHHHHIMCVYNKELFHTYCHNPGQSKVELSNLEWY